MINKYLNMFSDLQDAGNDGTHVWGEFVPEGQREVDEHHDVSVSDVRSDVHFTGRLDDVWHQFIQLLHT